MNAFQHINIIFAGNGQVIGVLTDQLGNAGGVQQLGNGAVTIAYAYNAVRDGGIDAQYKGTSCVFAFLLNFGQSILSKIGFYNGIIDGNFGTKTP